jgi:hypothetical protein
LDAAGTDAVDPLKVVKAAVGTLVDQLLDTRLADMDDAGELVEVVLAVDVDTAGGLVVLAAVAAGPGRPFAFGREGPAGPDVS